VILFCFKTLIGLSGATARTRETMETNCCKKILPAFVLDGFGRGAAIQIAISGSHTPSKKPLTSIPRFYIIVFAA
jgi:hypothetical protein